MRKDSYFLLNCKQFVDIFFVLWTFADFFSGYASVWGPWYSQKQSMAEFILKMKSAIVREAPVAMESGNGRGDRTRTCDSLVPNQERYQLRYTS